MNLVFRKDKIEQNLKFRNRTRCGCTEILNETSVLYRQNSKEILNETCVLYRKDSNEYCLKLLFFFK